MLEERERGREGEGERERERGREGDACYVGVSLAQCKTGDMNFQLSTRSQEGGGS